MHVKNEEAQGADSMSNLKKFTDMTTSVLMSTFDNAYPTRKNRKQFAEFSQLIYNVTVTDEDNESRTYEIMADSCSQACAVAEDLASSDMINIAYIDVQVMG